MPRTIHVEGLPGSGKSTAAERLCTIFQSNGVDAAWWLEELADHPIMPVERRSLSREDDFSQLCLEAWRSFLASQANTVSVLDGYAFQSTVRFLYEKMANRDDITNYFRQWQKLAPDASIIYLAVDNPADHFEMVLPERGDVWTQKLIAWVEQTPIGIASGLQGKAGFVEFWSNYQQLCFELLESAFIEVAFIQARSWDDHTLKTFAKEG